MGKLLLNRAHSRVQRRAGIAPVSPGDRAGLATGNGIATPARAWSPWEDILAVKDWATKDWAASDLATKDLSAKDLAANDSGDRLRGFARPAFFIKRLS